MDAETMDRLLRQRISTDTRLLKKGDVFFALIGKRFDAHDFILEALGKGVSHFVVSDRTKVKTEWLTQADFVFVNDTLTAYGDLARYHRQKFKVPAVAVTGSTGKTTVKELLEHLLSSKFRTLKNRGTENNLVGVPKSLLQLEQATQVMVLEMGTNAPGEIERLSSIIRPQIAILTQIGHSHLEGLKDLQGVREEKLSVLKHLDRGGLLVVNGEDPMLTDVKSGVHRVIRVGFDRALCEVAAERILGTAEGTVFYWSGLRMETQLVGRHNVLNCLLALQAASALGVASEALQKALAVFKAVPGRLTIKKIANMTFLDDSYNSNPTSFAAAIETLSGIRTDGKKGVVCGDMLELGPEAEAFHRELGRALARSGFHYVVACGTQSAALAEEAVQSGFPRDRIVHVKDSVEAGRACQKFASSGDWVLVKGSRGMQMEKVFECYTSCSTR